MSSHVELRHSDKDWYQLIDESTSLSAKSKTSYKKQIRVVERESGVDGPYAISTVLSNPDKYAPILAQKSDDNSLRTYLGAIVSLFKRGEEGMLFKRSDGPVSELQAKWSELLQQSSKRYHKRIDDNEPSERETEGHATLKEWEEAFEASYAKSPTSQETLLLALHALVMPPLRGGDLGRVHIGYTDEGNCAYRDPTDDKCTILLIRDHKTTKSHGSLERKLRGRIVTVMRQNVASYPRDWLFITQGGSPYSESGYSSWKSSVFHEAFGRPVTSNSLRHAYISGMDRQNQSVTDAQNVARMMGHGLYTQRQYVRFGK
jgi:hypothetical protein